MTEDKYRTSIAIVMPAGHVGATPMSHCTVAFLGNTTEVDYTQAQAQRLVDRLGQLDFWTPTQRIRTHSVAYESFGVEKDIPVAILKRDERILELRWRAEQLMTDYGIDWSKTWDYTPHVTLTPGTIIDELWRNGWDLNVSLRRPVLWWGNDRPQTKDLKAPFHV